MAVGEGEVLTVYLASGGRAGQIACPAALHPLPGQYLLASQAPQPGSILGRMEVLPVALFPALPKRLESHPGVLSVSAPLPEDWMVGTCLHLRGALGRGFQLPTGARRVALAAWGSALDRILSIGRLALAQGGSVALYSRFALENLPAGLPAEIEIVPEEGMADLLSWADYFALDLPREQIAAARRALRIDPDRRPGAVIEALIETPMPCGGEAECGVCAVKTRRGWKLACQDGPVFDFYQLEDS